MNEKLECACGWQLSPEQRKQVIETAGFTWHTFFVQHLQEKHYLPIKWNYNQFHQLLDKLDAEYHA